jgi:hypothetical protein
MRPCFSFYLFGVFQELSNVILPSFLSSHKALPALMIHPLNLLDSLRDSGQPRRTPDFKCVMTWSGRCGVASDVPPEGGVSLAVLRP